MTASIAITTRWAAALLVATVLGGCASGKKAPDWAINEQGAAERATDAYLSGNSRVADAEWRRARDEVSRTARPDLLARLELARCAAQVAALDAAPCLGFDAVAQDAAADEQAYARYLRGQLAAGDVALLPKAQQAVTPLAPEQAAAALAAIEDPLSRLVAAGVLAVRGPVPMAVVTQAVDTASAQGWRRAVMAWLINQQRLARALGDTGLADQVQRRLDLLQATQK
ncbi:hypothetical protein M2375_004031 [Comamonas sp. BIGb0152]|uniref:hypothetical protein n=1 Tax=Comamonas sp. BIGb0152 TaxID=2940601 RepID=UPI002168F769|nr:hypothetical protein [Comamonas sp. BIGb0152]MCS4295784.1 hypothetical protein [Comamonas sp. BIGb0152]